MSKTSQAFLAAIDKGVLGPQVQIARTVAADMLVNDGLEDDPHSHVDALVGRSFDRTRTDGADDLWEDYCHHISAALALGIAIGQLVHPDAFKTGGTR